MALNLNHVLLGGHLTRDPQLRKVANDRVVVDFGFAINRRYKTPEGETKEESTFLDIEAWGRTAELVGQYLTKGSPLYVEGRLKLDSWQDKDGNRRSKLKVVAENIQFIGAKRDKDGASGGHGASADGDGGSAQPRIRIAAGAPVDDADAAEDKPPF